MSARRLTRLSLAILVTAIALSAGTFTLIRELNQRDTSRLLTLEAGQARTTMTSIISVLESAMSSAGSVAAASNGSPAALGSLTRAIPSLTFFTALAVAHLSPPGTWSLTQVRGKSGAPPLDLGSPKSRTLARILAARGFDLLGFVGQGAHRRLAVADSALALPYGYLVYAEVPLPSGLIEKSGFPGLQDALYSGRTTSSPVLFASTKALPLAGERVTQLVDLNNLESTAPRKPGAQALLFVVSSSGSILGTLPDLLPWILAAVVLLGGIVATFVVESTARRRDFAVALASDMKQKNAELDRALTERAEAEKDRTRVENELRQAQRLESIGQLAGGVAHDFNNLLMVILTHNEFMAQELPQEHTLQEDLGEVRKAAKRAAELTRQLLVFSRRDLVNPSVLDLNASISSAVDLLRRTLGENIQFKAVLAPDLPRVLCDPGELQQVLMNLVVNARQAIEADGTITIETSELLLDEDIASTHAELSAGRYVQIAVSDTGCGMSPDTASRVFEPYFTTKDPGSGTGLGLSTVYGILKRYRGYVTVYSEVGVGTTFKVYLPATDALETAPEELPTEEPRPASGTILVVEDEAPVRNACKRILERAGFRVIEATDGVQALAKIDGLRIDLLLTDVVMPGGMSGRDLAQHIEQLQPSVPVLFMSGYTADVIATRGVLEPGVNVIEKPFSSADLLNMVSSLL